MLVDEKLKQHVNFTGFLHDFDYSLMTSNPPREKDTPLSSNVLTCRLRHACGEVELCAYIVRYISTFEFMPADRLLPLHHRERRTSLQSTVSLQVDLTRTPNHHRPHPI